MSCCRQPVLSAGAFAFRQIAQRVKMAEVETLIAAKQKELEALEQRITKVTGRDPNERYGPLSRVL